jgi:uncharacterized protein (TIGR02466 family)
MAQHNENDTGLASELARNEQIEYVFSTPIFCKVRSDAGTLNDELRRFILELERTRPGVTRSNQGGWQSAPDFFNLDHPAITTLERYVEDAVRIASALVTTRPDLRYHLELYGWAAINRKGNYNTTHVHPMATWSGVYYVDPGDEKQHCGGLIEFVHPVMASVMTFFPNLLPSARILQPKAGMLILFPSYLQHNVRLYSGEKPRICIPFNAHLHPVA